MARIMTLNIRGVKRKENHLIKLIRDNKLDVLLLQETYITTVYESQQLLEKIGLRQGHFNKGTINSSGTATIICSDAFEIVEKEEDGIGKTSYTRIKNKDNDHYLIINTCSPLQKTKQQRAYFEKILNHTTQMNKQNHPIIWGGDFNNEHGDRDKDAAEMKNTVETLDLISTLDQIKGENRTHTFKQRNCGWRKRLLDRFYISNAFKVYEIEHIKTENFTDHLGVLLYLSDKKEHKKNKGYWKLNNTLLEYEEFIKELKHHINFTREEIEKDKNQAVTMWLNLKGLIQKEAIRFGQKIGRMKRREEKTIRDARSLATDPKIQVELDEKIEQFNIEKYRGAAVRAKISQEEIEIPTRHYLAREQNVQRKRVIQKITKENGEVTDKEEEIKETFSNFYKQLYSKGETDNAIQERYSKKTKKITNEMKEAMDKKITKEKIEQSISELNKNKTPGPDGITNEFYQHFKKDITPIIFEVLEQVYINKNLPKQMTQSYITLIPKNDQDLTKVKNYRPISLLNSDYKILSKILTNRLKPRMTMLLHKDQQCAVKERSFS